MVIELGNYTAYTSDRYNSFEWSVIVFENNECVMRTTYDHKPTEQEIKDMLERCVKYGI